tara:strand:+ start:1097 stop:1567 length:471 start_codon:yes stop_codon:yes gene_type:complete
MTLKEKLEKLKNIQERRSEPDWDKYRKSWVAAVHDLLNTVHLKWFNDYEQEGLMEFSIVPVKRIDPYIGEYLTAVLEITLSNNKFLVLEPMTAITAEYDGKLEFYMRGNVYKKVSILRKIISDTSYEWVVAKTQDPKDHHKLDKSQLEKLIDQWLQ